MKLLKAFLIFFITFGVMYFFTGFSYADFNYINWQEKSRNAILGISFLITFTFCYFKYMLD